MIRIDLNARRSIAAGYMLLILALSLRPVEHQYPYSWSREMLHNLLHTPAYGLMALLVFFAGGPARPSGRRGFGTAFWVCFLYGAAIEVVQGLIPGRHPSWLDIALNAAGIGLAFYLMKLYRSWKT